MKFNVHCLKKVSIPDTKFKLNSYTYLDRHNIKVGNSVLKFL